MSNFTAVKDSGKRQEFSTGSVRDTQEGKGRYDLISPIALARLAKHYENGAKKYGDRNWEKGQPLGRYLDSALRHINNFREGDRSEDHLSAAAWNLFSLIHTEEMVKRGSLPESLVDLVGYMGTGGPEARRRVFENAIVKSPTRWSIEPDGTTRVICIDGREYKSHWTADEVLQWLKRGEVKEVVSPNRRFR